MVRKDDAGALDALDLDDMFAEDGDMLFEGLDVDMEGMGDILGGQKKESPVAAPPPPLAAARPRGPRTKRPPPPPDDDGPATSGNKRRKTKRKTKTPIAFGDDDEDYFDETQPRKKTRKAAMAKKTAASSPTPPAGAAKKKKTKKGAAQEATATSKAKKGASGIPPPGSLLRGSSSSVAAAGQFGGRLKRGSSSTLPKVKRKVKGAGVAEGLLDDPSVPALYIPKTESSYGGLHPSKTHFYPFMESLPQEPTMKHRRQYPIVDKVAAAVTAQLNAATASAEPPKMDAAIVAGITMESPVVQLLQESFQSVSEKDRAAFTETKQQALLASLPAVRTVVENQDKTKILGDLYAMCAVLTRQYNFLKTSLTNMETWCQANFSDLDYRMAYSLPEPFQPEKVGTAITASNRKWKKPVIPVKIVFAGYKEPKPTLSNPGLFARLPLAVVLPPDKKKDSSSSSSKKKKKSTSSSSASASTAVVTVKAPSAPLTYAECSPLERRQRILDKISQLALALESQLTKQTKKASSTSSSGAAASSTSQSDKSKSTQKNSSSNGGIQVLATYIAPEDPPLHTARMWEWLDVAGFFKIQSAKDLELRLQAPEIHPKGLFLSNPAYIQGLRDKQLADASSSMSQPIATEVPEPAVSSEKSPTGEDGEERPTTTEDVTMEEESTEDKAPMAETPVSQETIFSHEKDETLTKDALPKPTPLSSSLSLFDRLQSLLVIEDDDLDDEREESDDEGDDYDGGSSSDDESVGLMEESFFDGKEDGSDEEKDDENGGAEFSLEERTFLQLLRIGLIKKPVFPDVELILSDPPRGVEGPEDDLVNVIGEMSADLGVLTSRNNARIGYLQSAVDPVEVAYRKQVEEENSSLLSKCQNLLKRSKAKKTQAKKNQSSATGGSGSGSKDDLNLPW